MAIGNNVEKNANWLFHDFVDVCREVDAGVHTDVIRAGEGVRMSLGYALGYSTAVVGAIATAAKLLRESPDIQLARKLLPLECFQDDAVSRVLAGLINGSLTPADETTPQFTSDRKLMHACIKTEFYWSKTLHEMGDESLGMEVFIDNASKPLFIRKSHNRTSSLPLQSFRINAVTYPPFSVVRLQAKQDITKYAGAEQIFFVDPEGVTVRPASDVDSVTYLRPSIFGVPTLERPAHFTDYEFPLHLYDNLTATSISSQVGTFLERTDVVY